MRRWRRCTRQRRADRGAELFNWALTRVCDWPRIDPGNTDGRHRQALSPAIVRQAACWWRTCEILWGSAPPPPPDDPPLNCPADAVLAGVLGEVQLAMERLETIQQQRQPL